MTDETPRGLTPAVRLVSPMYDFFGTLYPYINMKSSGFTPYIGMSSLIQMPSKDRSHPSTPSHSSKSQPPIVSPLDANTENHFTERQ